MGKPVSRLGDSHSHGGQIIEASDNVFARGRRVARVGDKATCPIHGIAVITTGSGAVFVNGRAAARVTSQLSCGAVMVEGDEGTLV